MSKKLCVSVGVLVVAFLFLPSATAAIKACDGPKKPKKEAAILKTSSGLEQALADGAIAIENIQANQDGETTGAILTVGLTNPGLEEIFVDFPCGLVFAPDDSGIQRLMMVQPGRRRDGRSPPYVVCVDARARAPHLAATYNVGSLTENLLLLKLAECVCDEQLEDSDGIDVQAAAWRIQLRGGMQDSEGVLSDFLSSSEESEGLADTIVGDVLERVILKQVMGRYSKKWLKKCDIKVEK